MMKSPRHQARSHTPSETPAKDPIDLSQYRILVAGSFAGSIKELAALSEQGVKVSVVAMAPDSVRKQLEALALDELVLAGDENLLQVEAFRRASAAHLVVLAGESAHLLERTLLPLLQECAMSSMDDLMPLVRMDDPSLRYLRTGKRWAFYLVGRALGLPPDTARDFMEDCCGYEKQNQNNE